ncbi:GGDEF domain-containing protein [Actinoalloteichus hymeniacidonis]|uniref:Diguanylate cyclase (GGDEF) domain-containing protein n=1 Tax=Actinoalloteichus hymeniacidonis TaxID=340345 RepID=A0AAC9HSU3_9PSEU|nr:GGDEF domain-containing protein [Actinoalloteichus hymeniacidonis]AOS65002.1 diguanylate cyclase (GGDEF) domain-containing protein [Actinoalloteichus hymeniacidonis]MBB5906921.1 diguanylate cyclase (GGDEF)-like protein [Actinoalloteichus hymeniacidonis]
MFSLLIRSGRLRRLVDEHAALRREVRTDPLTGLPNRRALNEVAAEPRGRLGVLLLDLDQFKAINDSHGHRVGDELLCAVSDRLRHLTHHAETPFRLHGDEFAVYLGEGVDAGSAAVRAREISTALADAPFDLESGLRVWVGASVGAAVGECGDLGGVLAQADAHMYRVKHARKADRATVAALPITGSSPTARTHRDGAADRDGEAA